MGETAPRNRDTLRTAAGTGGEDHDERRVRARRDWIGTGRFGAG
jgi:hypothetical protein